LYFFLFVLFLPPSPMDLIPFVKSNSSSTETTTHNSEDSTNTSTPSDDNSGSDLGLRVAEIYQSIVALKPTPKKTTTDDNADHDGSPTKATSVFPLEISGTLPVYCKSCELVVRDPGHIHGTAHLVSTEIPQQPRRHGRRIEEATTTTIKTVTRLEMEHGEDSAMHVMKKYGWRPGKGLGKSNQGTRYPVATVWKQDRLGIGHPRTDRRRITHPSISKPLTKGPSSRSPGGKKLATDAKAEATLRSAMLHYMNN
jgi:hypothetical protein